MKKRQLLLVMIMLFTLVVATQVSLSQGRGNGNKNKNTNTTQNNNGNNGNSGNNGGNADCPAGTTEVAKFNYNNGSYVLEYGGGVTINGNASGGTWSSTSFISHIVVKGGPAHYIAVIVPAAQSGTFTNFGLPLVGNGNTPGISNIKFCAGEPPTPTPTPVTPTPTPVTPTPTPVTPTPDPDFDCEDAIASGQLGITKMSDNGVTFNYTITNNSPVDFSVSAVSYYVYNSMIVNNVTTPVIDDQKLAYVHTLPAPKNGGTADLSVMVPACAHQVDVICGNVIYQFGYGPGGEGYYGNRKIRGIGDISFEGYFYGPRPEGSWSSNLCK